MKLRIKGNSIRFRLNRTDVKKLSEGGFLEEHTHFGNAIFSYAADAALDASELSASLEHNRIVLHVPDEFLKGWDENDKVGMKSLVDLKNGQTLSLLIEKDFVCLDDTEEDQSDNYTNPNAACVP